MLIRISSNYFVAGYDCTTGNIAPIIKYMRLWSIKRISDYCKNKNWHIEFLE